jgi:hypothetical protein
LILQWQASEKIKHMVRKIVWCRYDVVDSSKII